MSEPTYGPPDPFEDEFNPLAVQDWQRPSENGLLILSVFKRRRYNQKWEQREVEKIAEGMEWLEDNPDCEYPIEWIEQCLDWVRGKHKQRQRVQLKGLLTLINREEAREDFVYRWKQDYLDDSW